METKHLLLLMLVPILLVGLVIYTDNPILTGAVTAQQEKNNILGTYSIIPSFKVKIDYDLNEYKNIKENLNQVINDCIEDDNIEECFKAKADENNWNCEEKDEVADILYDFVDKFNECLNLKENNVVCKFSLDERDLTKIRTYTIQLRSENQKIKAELFDLEGRKAIDYINQENLFYTNYDDRDKSAKTADVVKFIVKPEGNKPVIKEAFSEIPSLVQFSKTYFYKAEDELRFIEAGEEGLFRAPGNKIIDLPRIKGFKFCAKSKKQVYAHDSFDNTVKLRPIVYRFAVTYPKQS